MVIERFRPIFTKNNSLFDALYGTEADELNLILIDLIEIKNNQYLKTSNSKGLKRYEELYSIPSDNSLTNEERIQQILDAIMFRPPITYKRLYEILVANLGAGNFSLNIDYDNYKVYIDLYSGISTEADERTVKKIRELIPANLYVVYIYPYTYQYLKKFYNYGEYGDGRRPLSRHTYGELSSHSSGKDNFVINYLSNDLYLGLELSKYIW